MIALSVAGWQAACMAGSFVCERRQRLAVCGIRPGLSRGAAACLRSWGRRWARFPFMSMTIDCTVCGRLPAWQTHTSVSATPLPAFRGRQILSGLLHSLVLAALTLAATPSSPLSTGPVLRVALQMHGRPAIQCWQSTRAGRVVLRQMP